MPSRRGVANNKEKMITIANNKEKLITVANNKEKMITVANNKERVEQEYLRLLTAIKR